jgi:large subunit ribosomal protein L31
VVQPRVAVRAAPGFAARATSFFERRDHVKGNHPELVLTTVRCSTCGNSFATRSIRSELAVDVCSSCHPAYTGVERTVTAGSRIERFERRRAAIATR